MTDLLRQLPSEFDIDHDARDERLRRRLAGVLRQLEHRIGDLQEAQVALEAERQLSEQLRAEVADLESQLAAARNEYHCLINTKSFRLADKPRRIYGQLLRLRRRT